jgi:hypothetical protein
MVPWTRVKKAPHCRYSNTFNSLCHSLMEGGGIPALGVNAYFFAVNGCLVWETTGRNGHHKRG